MAFDWQNIPPGKKGKAAQEMVLKFVQKGYHNPIEIQARISTSFDLTEEIVSKKMKAMVISGILKEEKGFVYVPKKEEEKKGEPNDDNALRGALFGKPEAMGPDT